MEIKYPYRREKCEVVASYNPKADEIKPNQLFDLTSTILRAVKNRIKKRRVIGKGLLEHLVLDDGQRTRMLEFGIVSTHKDLRLSIDVIHRPKNVDLRSLSEEVVEYLDNLKLPKQGLINLGAIHFYGVNPIDFSLDYDSMDDLVSKNNLTEISALLFRKILQRTRTGKPIDLTITADQTHFEEIKLEIVKTAEKRRVPFYEISIYDCGGDNERSKLRPEFLRIISDKASNCSCLEYEMLLSIRDRETGDVIYNWPNSEKLETVQFSDLHRILTSAFDSIEKYWRPKNGN